jgi:predicted ATP-grasp superfamily ATP-dependent carboligase
MRKLTIMMAIISTVLIGCNVTVATNNEADFKSFAQDFYIQMLTDGEQSMEVSEMYGEMVGEYESYDNEELYENLAGMYEALGGEGDAEQYRQQITKILNEGVE